MEQYGFHPPPGPSRRGRGSPEFDAERFTPYTKIIMKPEKKRAICGICSAGCWVKVAYDSEGKIDTVEPDDGSPLGKICRLGELAREIVYSPNRLLHPLRRKGPKGTYRFRAHLLG